LKPRPSGAVKGKFGFVDINNDGSVTLRVATLGVTFGSLGTFEAVSLAKNPPPTPLTEIASPIPFAGAGGKGAAESTPEGIRLGLGGSTTSGFADSLAAFAAANLAKKPPASPEVQGTDGATGGGGGEGAAESTPEGMRLGLGGSTTSGFADSLAAFAAANLAKKPPASPEVLGTDGAVGDGGGMAAEEKVPPKPLAVVAGVGGKELIKGVGGAETEAG